MYRSVVFRRFVIVSVANAMLAFGLTGAASAEDSKDSAKDEKRVEVAATGASALRLAKSQGSPVLVEDETTQVALTYANPDGSYTQEISAAPERVYEDGKWQDLDTRLKPHDDVLEPTVAGNSVKVAEGADKGDPVASMATTKQVLTSAARSMAGKQSSE